MTVIGSTRSDADLATTLATDAGRLLLEVRRRTAAADERTRRDAGDREAQALLGAGLASARPDDVVLSEEAADDPRRHTADRVWIIDPLDGTREFGEAARIDWAVHVALWDRAVGDLVAGAVALPAQGLTLSSEPAPPQPPAYTGPPRLVVSRTRPPALAAAVAQDLGGELVAMGSAGAKAMAVVQGLAEVYLHAGGQYEWDSAAPVAVARAAGLHCSRLDGSPLAYNGADTLLPDLLICRPEFAEPVLARVAQE